MLQAGAPTGTAPATGSAHPRQCQTRLQELEEVLLAPELDDHYGVPLHAVHLADADVAVAAAVLEAPTAALEVLESVLIGAQVRSQTLQYAPPAVLLHRVHMMMQRCVCFCDVLSTALLSSLARFVCRR